MQTSAARSSWVGFVFSILLFVVLVSLLAATTRAGAAPTERSVPTAPWHTCVATAGPAAETRFGMPVHSVARGRLGFGLCNATPHHAQNGTLHVTDLATDRTYTTPLPTIPPGGWHNASVAVPDEYGRWQVRLVVTLNGTTLEETHHQVIRPAGCSGWSVRHAHDPQHLDGLDAPERRPPSVACAINAMRAPAPAAVGGVAVTLALVAANRRAA